MRPVQNHNNPAAAPCLSVVMPVYNEAGTIARVLHTVLAQPVVQEIIVIDDASRDSTWEILQPFSKAEPRVKLFRHQINQGKGAALRTGFAHACAPLVIVQDADLEYDPHEYETLVEPIRQGYADVVFGSRFQGAGAHRVLYFWHALGNRLLTTASNMLTNINLTDIEAGFKVFKRDILQQLCLKENRFGFEPEIIAKISRIHGVRIYEVPISYHGRTYAEGKKVNWRDGISALRCIVQYNLFG